LPLEHVSSSSTVSGSVSLSAAAPENGKSLSGGLSCSFDTGESLRGMVVTGDLLLREFYRV